MRQLRRRLKANRDARAAGIGWGTPIRSVTGKRHLKTNKDGYVFSRECPETGFGIYEHPTRKRPAQDVLGNVWGRSASLQAGEKGKLSV